MVKIIGSKYFVDIYDMQDLVIKDPITIYFLNDRHIKIGASPIMTLEYDMDYRDGYEYLPHKNSMVWIHESGDMYK